LILFSLVTCLPETQKKLDLNALKLNHLLNGYQVQFKNSRLIIGGLLMGASTSFIYVFATIAPFIAINIYHMSSDMYGTANCIPPVGLILGSLASAKLTKENSFISIIRAGIWITSIGVACMLIAMWMNLRPLFSLFTPMIVIYFGLCFILANASTIAMSGATDKAHGAAVMSFINMGLATLVVFSLGLFPIKMFLLPLAYVVLSIAMLGVLKWLILIPPKQDKHGNA
jgi:DHA1 family bicyclomycin/chloramphenicol resistance-like MFS transporter